MKKVITLQDTNTFKHKAYRFRLYPNAKQVIILRQTIGCVRYIHNHFLAKWNDTYNETSKGLSYNTCATQLPILKQTLPWLKDVDSIALQSSVRAVADSFDRFFKKQNQAPRFKSKHNPVQSYTTRQTNGNIAVQGVYVQLPKLGNIKFAKSRELEGRILSATVRLAPSGKWFVAIVCEVAIQNLPVCDRTIGVDVGIKHLAVTSEGQVYANPRHTLRYQKQLATWQRKLSRRKRSGGNYRKAKTKVARIHERISNSRRDALHKLTSMWIRENQTICIEDLSIANMLKNQNLAKHIADVSWGELARQLQYKADWYGRTIKEVPTFAPSSQMCHVCKAVNPAIKDLRIRTWVCCHCNTEHDRDANASQNIVAMAI